MQTNDAVTRSAEDRINELLAHNNKLLEETREQRRLIRQVKDTMVDHLILITDFGYAVRQSLGPALGYPVDEDGLVQIGGKSTLDLAHEAAERLKNDQSKGDGHDV